MTEYIITKDILMQAIVNEYCTVCQENKNNDLFPSICPEHCIYQELLRILDPLFFPAQIEVIQPEILQ